MSNIGRWARRKVRKTRWHLVDSDVADVTVTRCGRFMKPKTSDRGVLEFSTFDHPMNLDGLVCKMCRASWEKGRSAEARGVWR